MTTSYRFARPVRMDELFNKRVLREGLEEFVSTDATRWTRFITDGRAIAKVSGQEGPDGHVWIAEVQTEATKISWLLHRLQSALDKHLHSEHEPQYYGFSTLASWSLWLDSVINQLKQRAVQSIEQLVASNSSADLEPAVHSARNKLLGKILVSLGLAKAHIEMIRCSDTA